MAAISQRRCILIYSHCCRAMPALTACNGADGSPVLYQSPVPVWVARGRVGHTGRKSLHQCCWKKRSVLHAVGSSSEQSDSVCIGSGWERGCWSLLERHICSLATGSEGAEQREGWQRMAVGSQVPRLAAPSHLHLHCLSLGATTQPCCCQVLQCTIYFWGFSSMAEDCWVL